MPIADTDIKYRLSGGAANTDPNASIGNAMSTDPDGVITTDELNNMWDNVSGDESAAGDDEYRCIYVRNEHGTLTWTAPVIWIEANTTSGDTTIAIALGNAAVSATETAVANESTAPSGPTFSSPANKGTGISLTDLAPNAYRAVWIKRTVTLGAAAFNNDAYTLKTEGETAA